MKKIFLFLSMGFLLTPLVLAAPQSLEENISEKSPIGDNVYTKVYSFIEAALLNSSHWDIHAVQKMRKDEILHQNDPDIKPHIANIYEGELASLLKILCKAQEECDEITLYQKEGMGIASSGLKPSIHFKSPRVIDFRIGILSLATMKEPKIYIHLSDEGFVYHEYLKAIYYNTREQHSYLAFKKENSKDNLIGYLNYIMH